jgi:hypothetical protein
MTSNEKIHKAVAVNFACHQSSLHCCAKLEDSVDAARAFYEHLKGSEAYDELFNKLMKKNRYANKLILIKRYLNKTK